MFSNLVNQKSAFRSSYAKPVFFQPKLSIHQPDDVYEQEADTIAGKLAETGDKKIASSFFNPPISSVQRKCSQCETEEKQLQRKANNTEPATNTGAENYLNSLSGGKSLTQSERSFFEPSINYDFSKVRLHTDSAANTSAKSLQAKAYTYGNNIVFAANEYNTGTNEGKKLMAHELVHVVQQSGPDSSSSVQRYSHDSSCKEDDLRNIVWPSDYMARQMTKKAINVLTSSASLAPALILLYSRYFHTTSPDISTILSVFKKVKAAFEENDYQYECVNAGCNYSGEVTTIPLIGGIGDIRLCVSNLSGRGNMIAGRTILHEFTHYYARTDDNGYCKDPVLFCPPALTTEQALDNADSYACFAHDLWSVTI